MSKYCYYSSIAQNSPLNRRLQHKSKSKPSIKQESSRQLELFPLIKKRQKPQIASVPGTSHKDPKRYRVVADGEILGEYLSLDEALQLAKGGRK